MTHRTPVLSVGLLAAALALSGCAAGGSSTDGMDHHGTSAAPTAGAGEGAVDDADVRFATAMIPHHQQAIDMVDILLAKDGVDAEVTALAERIRDAQQPEIDTMAGWLEAWGEDAHAGHGDDMDHGMMSDDDMAALEDASGEEASSLFLEQMIAHHEGAVEMAQTELDEGSAPDALALAQDIVDGQTAEIEEMRGMLAAD